MKLYIPELGDALVLTKDWTFDLYLEDRNKSLYLEIIKIKRFNDITKGFEILTDNKKLNDDVSKLQREEGSYWRIYLGKISTKFTLPKNTILIVDRIYIRKGAEDFSSVTFKSTYNGKKIRFWAKLKDINTIEFRHTKK